MQKKAPGYDRGLDLDLGLRFHYGERGLTRHSDTKLGLEF